MAIKADRNPIQPTVEHIDAGGLLADVLSGGDGSLGDEVSDAGDDVVDSSDSTEFDVSDLDADGEAETSETSDDEGDESEEEADGEEGDDAPAKAADAKDAKDKEEIEVTDDLGRRKIEIDYSDRAATKRAHQQAAGARKLYARNRELREAQTKLEAQVADGSKAIDRWTKLEGIYQSKGVDGVIETLVGRSANDYWAERKANEARLAAMSPAERAAHDKDRETNDRVAEAQRIKEEAEAERQKAKEEREQFDLERLESVVHPEFEAVRMAGKLGDAAREHRIDTMIWDYVQSELVRLSERGVPASREVVRQAFQDASSLFSSTIESRASQQTRQVIDKKKKQATKEAQSAVVQGERQLRQKMESNDFDFSNSSGASAFLAAAMGGKRRSK